MVPSLTHLPGFSCCSVVALLLLFLQRTNWTENYIKEVPVTLLRPGVDTEDT
jgi:hypothetical protein